MKCQDRQISSDRKQLPRAGGGGEGRVGLGVTSKGNKVSFSGNRSVLKLIVRMVEMTVNVTKPTELYT